MQYPNEIQAALLFDHAAGRHLDEAMIDIARMVAVKAGAPFTMPEVKPGAFYRLFGANLMVTVEYVDRPADPEAFRQALSSTVTGLACPDIRERLIKSRSHILVNVSHGVLGNSPEIMRMLQQIDYPIEGQSLGEFTLRLELCALVARVICDHAMPSAVHWTQSNQLVAGELFDTLAAGKVPGPMHVHPFLFGERGSEPPKVGIRTFGVRHFLGREVIVEPSVLPWATNYETILAFLAIALAKDGYVIPDGDTFGPEDRSLSYKVIHRDAEEGDVPLYELVALMHRDHGFQSDDFVPHDRTIDDRSPPAELMPKDDEATFELVNAWREKRALAEKAGGSFEVRARHGEPGATQPPAGPAPARPGFGVRPVFGRKKV